MSYQEKQKLVSVLSGLLLLIIYSYTVFTRYRSGSLDLYDLHALSVIISIFIGIGIVTIILIQILFHILLSISIAIKNREASSERIEKTLQNTMVEDEMGRFIDLKSSRIFSIFFSFGFLISLITLIINLPPSVMLNILFLSFLSGSIAEGLMSIHYYKSGIKA